MSADVASLEAELQEYKSQLETVRQGVQADPDNVELCTLLTELEEVITLTESAIAELKPRAAGPLSSTRSTAESVGTQKTASSASTSSVTEKWSKENHPAYQAGYRPPNSNASTVGTNHNENDTTTQTSFAVNDTVLAKWKSGDKSFYPARITSITGSTSKPVYIVTFKNYATTETLLAHEIKPVAGENKKRRADGSAASPIPTRTDSTPSHDAPSRSTLEGPGSTLDEKSGENGEKSSLSTIPSDQARSEPSHVFDGPVRPAKVPRKVKAKKELEAGKTKWQEFSVKGVGGKSMKLGKKESMFRTPDGINARVGFVGSGQEMRKDPSRSRHIYQVGEDDD